MSIVIFIIQRETDCLARGKWFSDNLSVRLSDVDNTNLPAELYKDDIEV